MLYLAMSPDGQTIVTGAGDETLRFWNAFPGPVTCAVFTMPAQWVTPCFQWAAGQKNVRFRNAFPGPVTMM